MQPCLSSQSYYQNSNILLPITYLPATYIITSRYKNYNNYKYNIKKWYLIKEKIVKITGLFYFFLKNISEWFDP